MPTAIAREDPFSRTSTLDQTKEASHVEEQTGSSEKVRKPFLSPPPTCFFLCVEIEKIELTSQMDTLTEGKQEVEALDKETTAAHKKMMDEWRKAIEKEKAAHNWSVAVQVFSWIGSFIGIISGAILIATGVGVVAGSLLITAGVIAISNQIMEVAGGWKAVKEALPGENEEQKEAVIAWMQMGIALLCLALSGAGIFCGGYKPFGEGMQIAMNLIGGTATAGAGASSIGKALNQFFFKDAEGEAKKYECILAELKHEREDVMEKIDDIPDHLERIFEYFAKNLNIQDIVNAAFQAAWR